MRAQIKSTNVGYVIEVFTDYEVPNLNRWYPIINFGDRQGDAIIFAKELFDKMGSSFIRKRISDYNKNKLYKLNLCDGKTTIIRQETEETR